MTDQRVEKWIRWIDAISADVQRILVHRQVFDEVGDIVRRNPSIQKPSAFHDLLGQGYTALAVMGVRRQVKIDSGSVSLAGLLTDIQATPECLSREWYKAQYGDDPQVGLGVADKAFEHLTESTGAHIDPVIPGADLRRLGAKVATIEQYADQHIAHLDRRALARGNTTPATYADLDDCLASLEQIVLRYYRLLKVVSIETLTPTFQYNWKKVFEVPWVDPPSTARE